MFFYKIIVLLIYAISRSVALKCYSCGDENLFLDAKYPDSPPCEEMDRSMDLTKFEIECPSEYLGCITQIKGKEIMRTCDVFAIDDCKTANGITYCYCSKDLCNRNIKQLFGHSDARKSSRDVNYPSDDEDYNDELDDNNDGNDDIMEASGMGSLNNDFDKDTMHREVEVIFNRSNKSSRSMINFMNLFKISFIFILLKTIIVLW